MADNIAITQGSGTTIGTDDVGGVQYQQVKLMDPTLDSSSPIATGQSEVTSNTLRVVQATDVGTSVNIISGSVSVTGSISSVVATGTTLHDAVDTGDAPLKLGGIAMSTNPTGVGDGDRVSARFDDIGRQIVTPFQARDLIATAFVTLSLGAGGGGETTLLTGGAGEYLDLVWVSASTTSLWSAQSATSGTAQGSIMLDIRSTVGGGIITELSVPEAAMGQAMFQPPIPWPQSDVNATWTVQAQPAGLSGTTVNISALFIRNV